METNFYKNLTVIVLSVWGKSDSIEQTFIVQLLCSEHWWETQRWIISLQFIIFEAEGICTQYIAA